MNTEQVKKLKPGDWVWWEDPDEEHSSYYRIETLSVKKTDEGSVVTIFDPVGKLLECYPNQLHNPDPYIRGAAHALCIPEESVDKEIRQLFKHAFYMCLQMRAQDNGFLESLFEGLLKKLPDNTPTSGD